MESINLILPGAKSDKNFSNIADIFVDDDFSVLVRVCVHDICYLHSLRDLILRDEENSFEKLLASNLGTHIDVTVDRTLIVEMIEEVLLQLHQLTPHQEEKLEVCNQHKKCDLHIKAPAGAGKTFIALHLMLQLLAKDRSEKVKVLFMASNKAMALFAAKWAYERMKGSNYRERALERLDLLFPDGGQFADAHVYAVKKTRKGDQHILETIQREPSQSYDLIVCDEAHNIFKDEVLANGLKQLVLYNESRLILLSDVSQSNGQEVSYEVGRNMLVIELDEVVRCTERLMMGAKVYQLFENDKASTRCLHKVKGPPISSFLFQAVAGASMGKEAFFRKYAQKTAQAIKEKVLNRFPKLSLDNRLAILVPNEPEEFRYGLSPYLLESLEGIPELGPFELIDAVTASCALSRTRGTKPHEERSGTESRKQRIVYDTIDAFDGLERLIVVIVGMDKAHSANSHNGLEVRSQIYRALTRAHMLVCIVNEYVEGGWMEFLGLVKFQGSHNLVAEEEQINNKAAEEAVQRCRLKKHVETSLQKVEVDNGEQEATVYDSKNMAAEFLTNSSTRDIANIAVGSTLESCVWETDLDPLAKLPTSFIAFEPFQNKRSKTESEV